MDFNNHLFRCSSLFKLMTQPQKKEDKEAGRLSVTTQKYLNEVYIEAVYNRRSEFSAKYIEKGIKMEEDGMTVLSRSKGLFLRKNSERLNNKFFTGEPDVMPVNKIGYDIKCPWSLFSMPMPGEELCDQYEYQNQGYIDLTGADEWVTVYCLVNAPANLVLNEKKSIWYALGCPDEESELYVSKCVEVEKNMIFDMREFLKEAPYFDFHCQEWTYDIPFEERVIEFKSVRDDDKIKLVKEKVIKSREHLNSRANRRVETIAA